MADQSEEPSIAVRSRKPVENEGDSSNAVQEQNRDGQEQAVNPQEQQQNPGQAASWKTVVVRMVIFWAVINFFRSRSSSPTSGGGSSATSSMPSSNLFKTGDHLELLVYLNEKKWIEDFSDTSSLIWKEDQLFYGNWNDGPNKDGSRMLHKTIRASEDIQNNGSLYLHVFVLKKGYAADPTSQFHSRTAIVNQTKLLTVYRKRRVHKTKNLLTGEAKSSSDAIVADGTVEKKMDIISYWHPNLTISLLDDQTPWTQGSLPQPMDKYIMFDNLTNMYYPVLYLNDYWNYAGDYTPINDTTPILELSLTYSPISLFKWQMYMSQQMRQQWTQYLGDSHESSEEEQDLIKRTLSETNPYLLGLTMVVSLVHSVFEFLAFKNDIQFWRTRKSLEGLSVRSVFFNVFQSLVVVLYVMDNETNTVVVVSCFVGLLIELWKITKVVDIKIDREVRWGPFPSITISDKSSYQESPTKKFDRMAFKYLSVLLFPLLGCFAVYSLMYNEHKGWYSFVLSMMYGFLLTFGFIMMTPQLFINYKLKSVAHLPWRMLTYKALNTFIDDIFAFVIKMPTLYRIGCLRDDVIFFIFLYQRYIYRVDMKRFNEFGTSGEPAEGTDKEEIDASTNGHIDAISASSSDKKND